MNFIEKVGDFLFGKISKIDDPFFGEMIDAYTHYECKRFFQPVGRMVEIGLEKKNVKSDKKQRDFFEWLEKNFDLIIERVEPVLENRINESIPGFKIQDFKTEFVLEYIYIPKCEAGSYEWQIQFFAANELQHSCTIFMNGLEITHILIDG